MRHNAMRAARFAAVVLALLAATPGAFVPGDAAAAPGALDAVRQRGVLVAGVKADFPPFGYIDKRGQQVGFDIDLAHELAGAILGDPSKLRLVTVTSYATKRTSNSSSPGARR